MFLESEKIIVLGRFWADFIAGRLAAVQNKIAILPNATEAISIDHEQPRGTEIHIAYLGVLTRLKGTRELIEALALLAKCDNWKATIAGSGDVSACRARVQELRIADRVDIPGWLGPGEVHNLLRRTDILVLPSHVENLPMTVLEGFAYGIAVVATPVGAIPEVIEPERNGLLVPVGDIEALANALRRLIENPDLRLRLGAAARQDHADRYDINTYIPRLAAIWREAHRGRNPSA
jgi:glycosyltransferase involved in cell wall biosynthesis